MLDNPWWSINTVVIDSLIQGVINQMSDYKYIKTNNDRAVVNSFGIGFCGLLAIAFIILKLCGVISWSWLWVLAPLWMPIVIAAAIIAVTLALICISESRKQKKLEEHDDQ